MLQVFLVFCAHYYISERSILNMNVHIFFYNFIFHFFKELICFAWFELIVRYQPCSYLGSCDVCFFKPYCLHSGQIKYYFNITPFPYDKFHMSTQRSNNLYPNKKFQSHLQEMTGPLLTSTSTFSNIDVATVLSTKSLDWFYILNKDQRNLNFINCKK